MMMGEMRIFEGELSSYSRLVGKDGRSQRQEACTHAWVFLKCHERDRPLPHRTKPVSRDPSCPPLFSGEEWGEIVRYSRLSPRQAEVVGLVIQSHKDKEIAALLDISPATVRTHICLTKDRLLAEDRVGLAYRVFWTYRHIIEPKRYPWI
jgi:ATP/maltotriose-dependent transcriptional regulator MalT